MGARRGRRGRTGGGRGRFIAGPDPAAVTGAADRPGRAQPAGRNRDPRIPAGAGRRNLARGHHQAFAHHPEQGGWTQHDLDQRLAADWFEASGFFLAWQGETLVGYHWTKVHDEFSPALGEVYVLGIAPAAQGLRLGTVLLNVGLRHLFDRGCGPRCSTSRLTTRPRCICTGRPASPSSRATSNTPPADRPTRCFYASDLSDYKTAAPHFTCCPCRCHRIVHRDDEAVHLAFTITLPTVHFGSLASAATTR